MSALETSCPDDLSHLDPLSPAPPFYTTEPEAIAAQLDLDWGQTFSAAEVDSREVAYFASEVRQMCPCDISVLSPGKDEVKSVVARAVDSGVGPDGIPYSGYKACSSIIAALILVFIQMLFTEDFQIEQYVLLAYMVFLPQKHIPCCPLA